jgi:hypothetical protein
MRSRVVIFSAMLFAGGFGLAGCSQQSANEGDLFSAGPNKVVLQVEPMV